jgi:hypothetical protein
MRFLSLTHVSPGHTRFPFLRLPISPEKKNPTGKNGLGGPVQGNTWGNIVTWQRNARTTTTTSTTSSSRWPSSLSNCPSEQRHKITGDKRYVKSHDKQYETHTTRSVYIYRRYNSRNDDRRHRISAEREMISCFGWVMIAVVIVTSSGLSPGHDHRHTHTHTKLPRPVTKLRCSPHPQSQTRFHERDGLRGAKSAAAQNPSWWCVQHERRWQRNKRKEEEEVPNTLGDVSGPGCQSVVCVAECTSKCVCVCICLCVCVCARLDGAFV